MLGWRKQHTQTSEGRCRDYVTKVDEVFIAVMFTSPHVPRALFFLSAETH